MILFSSRLLKRISSARFRWQHLCSNMVEHVLSSAKKWMFWICALLLITFILKLDVLLSFFDWPFKKDTFILGKICRLKVPTAVKHCPSEVYKSFPYGVTKNSSILIVQHGMWRWLNEGNYGTLTNCLHFPTICKWTIDQSQYKAADAIAYHYPEMQRGYSFSSPDPKKLSIGVSKEAFFNSAHNFYPAPNELSPWQYNVSVTYNLKSDIPYPYFKFQFLEEGRKKRPKFEKMKRGATAISSNCLPHSQRLEISQLLEQHIPVYYFGICLNNAAWPSKVDESDVVGVMKDYMFNFAFENTISEDYVTEKVFNALASGTIPVYHGTETVDKFLPSPDSIIRVADFSSVASLGQYLKKVSTNEALFNYHHAWRYQVLPKHLFDRLGFVNEDWYCRACKYVYARKFGCYWDHKRQQIGSPLWE